MIPDEYRQILDEQRRAEKKAFDKALLFFVGIPLLLVCLLPVIASVIYPSMGGESYMAAAWRQAK